MPFIPLTWEGCYLASRLSLYLTFSFCSKGLQANRPKLAKKLATKHWNNPDWPRPTAAIVEKVFEHSDWIITGRRRNKVPSGFPAILIVCGGGKKSNSICYHFARESVAMEEWQTAHISMDENLADLAMKIIGGGRKRDHLVGKVMHDIVDYQDGGWVSILIPFHECFFLGSEGFPAKRQNSSVFENLDDANPSHTSWRGLRKVGRYR